jgi:DNA-binding HxlR family transcriptional regulator
MKTHQPSRSPCLIGCAARVLGERWVPLILRETPVGKRARYTLTHSGEALVPIYREMATCSTQHLFEDGEQPCNWGQASDGPAA